MAEDQECPAGKLFLLTEKEQEVAEGVLVAVHAVDEDDRPFAGPHGSGLAPRQRAAGGIVTEQAELVSFNDPVAFQEQAAQTGERIGGGRQVGGERRGWWLLLA